MGADAHSRSSKGKYQAVPDVEAAPLEVESGSAKSPREEKRLAQLLIDQAGVIREPIK